MRKKTKQQFINDSKKIHGNLYDYSLVDYVNGSTPIKIVCPKHGEFIKKPIKHTSTKQGCPKCSSTNGPDKQRKTKEQFVIESRLIHGEKYDYSLVDYKRNGGKVKIICPVHGEFEQTPGNHLRGNGCKYCGGTCKMDTKIFITKAKEINGEKYDYSLVDYVDNKTPIKIICPKHGEFEQTPNNHTSKKQGCYECLGHICDLDSFKKVCSVVHDGKFDYTQSIYDNITKPIKIICPEHGEFEQRPDSHRRGHVGCSGCINSGTSKEEDDVSDFITSLGIPHLRNDKSLLSNKELDIYIPNHNIAIEYNGLYWHSETFVDKNHHLTKTNLCEEKGTQLIHIFSDEWLNKSEIVKSRLKNILGLTDTKFYGRKCDIRVVPSKIKDTFLDDNHIQGKCRSSVNIGLYYDDVLVSMMTFGVRPLINNHQYELIRFCNKINTTVVGGFSKLLRHFIKTVNPSEIVSYADRRWSLGSVYHENGFNFIDNTNVSYWYLIDKKRVSRFNYQKHKLVSRGYDINKTEHEIMLENGYTRVYDSGNKKYVLKL
jgi:hypothetical protein